MCDKSYDEGGLYSIVASCVHNRASVTDVTDVTDVTERY